MKLYRRLAAALLSAALLVSLAGCAAGGNSSAPGSSSAAPVSEPASQSAPASETGAFPVTLTDAAGRTVTLETQPATLVSGYYITTSMCIALGCEDRLVGIEAKADTRPIYALAAPELLELPSVGTAKEFDLEGCAALDPDLVILPLKLKDTADALDQLGIPALVVNPESLPELEQTLTLLGQATGCTDQAAELVAYNQQTEDFLTQTLAGADKPVVYLAGNSSYLSTAGPAMYQDTLIQLGGGVNAAAEITDTYWADISYEQLLAWNPDVIVIVPGADYTKEDLLADPQLADLTAVKEGKVFAMPSAFESWDSPVPSAMIGSLWMANVLHPDLYDFDVLAVDAFDFYEKFYGVEIDISLLAA